MTDLAASTPESHALAYIAGLTPFGVGVLLMATLNDSDRRGTMLSMAGLRVPRG